MIVITAIVFGALLGALRARKHGGSKLDMLQWGAGFAILFGILGLFLTIYIERMI
ncbi:hypothetical protein GCM10011452_03820 [Gemmobacter lanyuensis]|uniref:Apolipoprotein acyltransferase n=1 Tax=Gemmobacter lanyuensis TaxID=1054497 RepID=A0A918ILD5_9RHOB|nr:hypothetical protein [Gemmobacter lanyuensis]GGW21833.1 hypothetical protein GCM10011452_03820 [Gemmobacter lanyuensis]